jgi:hypothetical protein
LPRAREFLDLHFELGDLLARIVIHANVFVEGSRTTPERGRNLTSEQLHNRLDCRATPVNQTDRRILYPERFPFSMMVHGGGKRRDVSP